VVSSSNGLSVGRVQKRRVEEKSGEDGKAKR
jgi:hypothetical protein